MSGTVAALQLWYPMKALRTGVIITATGGPARCGFRHRPPL